MKQSRGKNNYNQQDKNLTTDHDFYQEHAKTKRKKRGGCFSCSCAALILIIIVIIAGIGLKAFIDVKTGTGGQLLSLSQQHQMGSQAQAQESQEHIKTALLMGIDTGAEGREEQGRSDTMILASVNAQTNSMNLVSIPRDSYVTIPGHGQDKINHAYAFGGPELARKTASQFFDIPIDYYFTIDMQGLVDVINALGGIEIVPANSFESFGYQFQEGVAQTLDGEAALAYSRQRYDDPEGDYGRQSRQREIITATMDKVSSMDGISSMPSVVLSLNQSVESNASITDLLAGFTKYSSSLKQVNPYQISGSGEMIDGIYYEMIPDSEVQQAKSFLLGN